MRIISIKKPVNHEALAILRREVATALDAGEADILVDIDDIGVLESYVISVLILVLRDARERGAAISLRASRPHLLDSLRITALDKVFTIVAADGAAMPVPVKRPAVLRHGGKFVAALAAGAFALGSLLATRASAAVDASRTISCAM